MDVTLIFVLLTPRISDEKINGEFKQVHIVGPQEFL